MTQVYNTGGTTSSIGASQMNDFLWVKKALIEVMEEQVFGQLSDTFSMPKNMGKTIKRYHYLAVLDDANINDQGIDAAGAIVNQKVSIGVTTVDGSIPVGKPFYEYSAGSIRYITGEGATPALAEDAARTAVREWATTLVVAGGLGLTVANTDAAFATLVTAGGVSAYDLGYRFVQPDGTTITAAAGALEAQSVMEAGNLWGSSKDIATIAGKLPALDERGGRKNRVGFTRIQLEGGITKFGIFDEYTKESMDFDSDKELSQHINRELLRAANSATEAAIQIDLLNAAGVIRYGGVATSTATISGVSGAISEPAYEDLMRLAIDLDNNLCPKHTTLITGTRMTDTRVVPAARFMYIGSELIPLVRKMKSIDTNSADGAGFISVESYAAGTTVAKGEIGQIGEFRIIVVPSMLHWAGAGATEGVNAGYRATGGNYDVFPMLVVGDKAFTTVGFQTDGKSVKFKIKHAKPESPESYAIDPYGEKGFMSIKWYYGSMILRPEHIALIKCAAQY